MNNNTINFNILELENKLAALKIRGRYIGYKTNNFKIDHYIQFDPDITINKVNARKKDIELFFNSQVSIELIDGYIVIRTQNENRQYYQLKEFIEFTEKMPGLIIPIGIDENNDKIVFDLRRGPHILVAGTTGSGKSVFLNNCIISLLQTNITELYLIDVKQVEFSMYENIGGAIQDVIYEPLKALYFLSSVCEFMDNRYSDMKNCKCRNFEEYKAKKPDANYITIVIDELADLLKSEYKKAIEKNIIRIASLGRAAGIHLILATQRPSADVITGLIRDNIPTRICFNVRDNIASRIIINKSGGELLEGNGDGLFSPIGSKELIHFQSPYISTDDIILSLEYYKNSKPA